jgi:DNA-binding transcriptional ArsR family regulator
MQVDKQQQPEKRTLESIAAIVAHPLRARCWVALTQRTASPKELADRFGEDLSNVSYHVKILREFGVIEEVRSEPVRGALQHFYSATQRLISDDEDTASRSRESRLDIARLTVQLLLADAAVALEDGVFVERPDHCVWRNPGVVDEEGWQEVNAACQEFTERIENAFAGSANRLGPEDDGIKVTVSALAFERDTPSDYWA